MLARKFREISLSPDSTANYLSLAIRNLGLVQRQRLDRRSRLQRPQEFRRNLATLQIYTLQMAKSYQFGWNVAAIEMYRGDPVKNGVIGIRQKWFQPKRSSPFSRHATGLTARSREDRQERHLRGLPTVGHRWLADPRTDGVCRGCRLADLGAGVNRGDNVLLGPIFSHVPPDPSQSQTRDQEQAEEHTKADLSPTSEDAAGHDWILQQRLVDLIECRDITDEPLTQDSYRYMIPISRT